MCGKSPVPTLASEAPQGGVLHFFSVHRGKSHVGYFLPIFTNIAYSAYRLHLLSFLLTLETFFFYTAVLGCVQPGLAVDFSS